MRGLTTAGYTAAEAGNRAGVMQEQHPKFEVSVTRTWHGLRLAAVRRDSTESGLAVAIGTPDEVDSLLTDAEANDRT